jgi:hypothetical protein
MGPAFYGAYFLGLVRLFAGLSWAFGLKIALLLSVAIPVSSVLLLVVLCSAPSDKYSGQPPRVVSLTPTDN